jgi:hypothetical protein
MQTIVGMFERRSDAEEAIQRLQAAGIRTDSIGVAMRDTRESGDLAGTTGADDLTAEGATAGAVSGAGVGALVGLALVGSTILIPGLGPVLVGGSLAAGGITAAGTTAAALTGAGLGAASGGLIGGLIGAGIPEHEATNYADRLGQGHILVTVRSDDAHAGRARQILMEEGAHSA